MPELRSLAPTAEIETFFPLIERAVRASLQTGLLLPHRSGPRPVRYPSSSEGLRAPTIFENLELFKIIIYTYFIHPKASWHHHLHHSPDWQDDYGKLPFTCSPFIVKVF